MKRTLSILLLFAAAAASAQITAVQGSRHAGSGTGAAIGPVLTSPSEPHGMLDASCLTPLADATVKDGVYTCKVKVTKAKTTTCAAAPGATTAVIACPAGTTGSWTQTTTSVRSAAPACTLTTTTSPATAPAGACVAVVTTTPPPVGAVVLHFSDCQAGAPAGCVPGSNANPGTEAAPKQNLAGVNLDTLPAGSVLRFKAGGVWANFNIGIRNLNATAAAPIVFEAYGSGAKPTLQTAASNAVNFGFYSDTVQDGGYTFRGLKFDGRGTAVWGFFLMGATRNVVLENNEITGFQIGLHAQNMAAGNDALVIRGNDIHHNAEMGILGDANNALIEGNTIRDNNPSGSGFNHGLYLGGHATNGIVRNNTFTNNSMLNGTCTGGNLTVHGQWTGLVIEGNKVQVDRAAPGCWGISINDGYTSPEFFRNVTVRNNETVNMECAICVRAAPGIVIEGNRIRSNQVSLPSGIIVNPPNGTDDDQGIAPVVRNNTACFTDPARTMRNVVSIGVTGGTSTGNVLRSGADATTGACAP